MGVTKNIIAMGLEEEKINFIQDASKIDESTSHLICFQSKFDVHTLTAIKKYNIKLLIIEEFFLSLTKKGNETLNIVSQYTYYGRELYRFLLNTSPLRVLIVDDDIINVNLIKAMLEDKFCHIDIATDGEMGLEMLIASTKPDREVYNLVYLDHHMPKSTGLEVIKAFRAIEAREQCKPSFIVSISGNTQKEENEEHYFDLHLGKPFNKEKIKNSFTQALKVV